MDYLIHSFTVLQARTVKFKLILIKKMLRLLSGNEAIALGAYHAGVRVAAAYPGTPSTEILESMARFGDVYAEWSTNEKVAMEVALGAAYAGALHHAVFVDHYSYLIIHGNTINRRCGYLPSSP